VPRILKLLPRRGGQWLELIPEAGEPVRLPLHAVPPGLEPGAVIEPAAWEELQRLAEYHALYDRALRILGRREHFTRELQSKLFLRTRNGALIQQVLRDLAQRTYLDDHRAAEYVAEFITQRGAVGPRLLKSELQRRGCPPELLEELVTKHAAEVAEEDVLGKLIASRRSFFTRKRDSLRTKLETKLGAGARGVASQLRAQLGASVLAWLAGRGFSDEEARTKARAFVEELLGEV
jgi:regulatory protein